MSAANTTIATTTATTAGPTTTDPVQTTAVAAAAAPTTIAPVVPSDPSPYLVPLPLPPSSAAALLVPPLSFALVVPGVFRSAHPSTRNFPFLAGLALKSILYLGEGAYPTESRAHFESAGIEVRLCPLGGNREPFVASDFATLSAALLFACDTRNQPVLVHCNKGKHRTGCFVGVLRRLSGFSLASVFQEYRLFLGAASAASRDLDRLMIECFDLKAFKKNIEQQISGEWRADWIE